MGSNSHCVESADFMYRPLPDELTIKSSPIEGLGLFATQDIKANTFIGITHIRDEQFENKYIRTPLGGFTITLITLQFKEWFLIFYLV